MNLALKMTLLINDSKTEDKDTVGAKMVSTTTGQDLFPNIVTIKVKGRDPPTMTLEEWNELAQECKDAELLVPRKY